MFLIKIMLNEKFYTKISKKILIWALRSEERDHSYQYKSYHTVINTKGLQEVCNKVKEENGLLSKKKKTTNSQIIHNKDQHGRSVMWLRSAFLAVTSYYISFAREQSEAETSLEWKACASFLQMGGTFSFLACAVLCLMI